VKRDRLGPVDWTPGELLTNRDDELTPEAHILICPTVADFRSRLLTA
jgi:hypothetical protein